MLISHQHQFVFVKTRKTAGTSIERALTRQMAPEDVVAPVHPDELARFGGLAPQNRHVHREQWRARDYARALLGRPPAFAQHSPAWFIRRSLPADQWDGYLKFAVERNSWDLAVSAYCWVKEKWKPGLTFEQFVFSDTVRRYSNWRLYTIDNEVAVDHLIRYDELETGLAVVTDKLGLTPLDLPRIKSGHRDRRPYQEWYTPETRHRVSEVFHQEIDYFGWRF